MVGQEKKTIRQRIHELLSDGYLHSREELMKCFDDDQASYANLAVHLSMLRSILRPQGQDVSPHQMDGTTWYQLVRIIRKA